MKEWMNKPKTRAAMWVAACALYMLCGEILRLWDMRLGAIFAMVLGMYCAAECFSCGREYERDKRKELEGVSYAWDKVVYGMHPMRCQVCNCPIFTEKAGRFICACCGEVLEAGEEEDGHGEETKV